MGRAGVMLFDHLHWDPIISQWVRLKRGRRGGLSGRDDVNVLKDKGLPWMQRLDQKFVAPKQKSSHAVVLLSCQRLPTITMFVCSRD